VSVVDVGIQIQEERSWSKLLINRRERSEPAAKWQVGNGGPRSNQGDRPAHIVEALVLEALRESNKSKLKSEKQRDKIGAKPKLQQAAARLTPTMSPSE